MTSKYNITDVDHFILNNIYTALNGFLQLSVEKFEESYKKIFIYVGQLAKAIGNGCVNYEYDHGGRPYRFFRGYMSKQENSFLFTGMCKSNGWASKKYNEEERKILGVDYLKTSKEYNNQKYFVQNVLMVFEKFFGDIIEEKVDALSVKSRGFYLLNSFKQSVIFSLKARSDGELAREPLEYGGSWSRSLICRTNTSTAENWLDFRAALRTTPVAIKSSPESTKHSLLSPDDSPRVVSSGGLTDGSRTPPSRPRSVTPPTNRSVMFHAIVQSNVNIQEKNDSNVRPKTS